MNRLIFPLKADVALVTATQASTSLTAFEHANGWSLGAQQGLTAALSPPNHLSYIFDGYSARDRFGRNVSLHDMKNTYLHLYYCCRDANFGNSGFRVPPDAIIEPVYTGSEEAIAELTAIGVTGTYDPEASQAAVGDIRWTTEPCTQSRCIVGQFATSRGEIV